MDYNTWAFWQTLRDYKLLPSRLKQKLEAQTSKAKFYCLRGAGEGLGMAEPDGFSPTGRDRAFYVNTAQYVRGWMRVYSEMGQDRALRSPHVLNTKYRVTNTHVQNPELFSWYEVGGLELAALTPMTTKMDTFEYNGPMPQVLRELTLDTFSLQLAELLH